MDKFDHKSSSDVSAVADGFTIEDYAVKQGMKTLKMSCLRHILEGETTIDEQVRILGLASEI